MGIDEAGRGPVLGPMVYGAMIWKTDFDCSKEFENHTIDDSKQVNKQDREKSYKLFENLKN